MQLSDDVFLCSGVCEVQILCFLSAWTSLWESYALIRVCCSSMCCANVMKIRNYVLLSPYIFHHGLVPVECR